MYFRLRYVKKIIMWETFAGRTPYYFLKNPQAIIKYVYYENGRPDLKDIRDNVDPEILNLIEINWQKDPEKRQEFKDIIPILQEFLDKNIGLD